MYAKIVCQIIGFSIVTVQLLEISLVHKNYKNEQKSVKYGIRKCKTDFATGKKMSKAKSWNK